jgi:uncharacterized protein YndB with AHSA1/START domain
MKGNKMEKNDKELIAVAKIAVDAPVSDVWEALVNPDKIRQYMFGTTVVSDWQKGAPITWQGEWQGKAYTDKGKILKIEPEHVLQYSHFSPLSGQPDAPANYHTVTIELSTEDGKTTVTLTQDNNESETARQHAEANWQMMLASLKQLVES